MDIVDYRRGAVSEGMGIYFDIMKKKSLGFKVYKGHIGNRNAIAFGIALGILKENGIDVQANLTGEFVVNFEKEYESKKHKILNGTCLIHSKEGIIRKANEAFESGTEVFVYIAKLTYTPESTLASVAADYGAKGYKIDFDAKSDELIITKKEK